MNCKDVCAQFDFEESVTLLNHPKGTHEVYLKPGEVWEVHGPAEKVVRGEGAKSLKTHLLKLFGKK